MTIARPGSLLTKIPAFLGWLAFGMFCGLSLSTNAATRFYQWPWFFYWQVLVLAPIAILAARLLCGARLARFGGWMDAGLGLLAAAAIGSALLSPFRFQSLNLALIPVAGISLAYLGLDWVGRRPEERDRRAGFLAEGLGASMVLFVATSLGLWLFARVLPARSAGSTLAAALRIRNLDPFGHSLYTAGAAVLSAPWLAALALTGPRRWRWPRWAAAGLAVALVPTTSSRGGVAALVTLLGGAATIWLTRAALTRRQRLLAVAGALALAALAVLLDPRLRDLVRHRQWSTAATDSNRQHAAMLEAGWLMGCARPWTGCGPGTVPLVYPKLRAQLSGGTDNVLQLHNTPAQLWAELGAPGIVALMILVVGVFQLARAGCQGREGTTDSVVSPARAGFGDPVLHSLAASRIRAQAVVIAFAGYAVMSLFDYQLDVPWFAATVAALLVLLRVAATNRAAEAAGPAPAMNSARLAGGLLFAGLAAMGWATAQDLRARQVFADAADAREAGETAAFVAGAERAAATAPNEPFYLTQLAAFQGEQYLRANDEAEQTRARDRCAEALRRTLLIDPDQDYCHFNLGWLLLAQQPAEAAGHFRASARLSPYRGGVYLGLGLSLLGRDGDAAATALALEWVNDPQAVSSPRWDQPPLSAWRGRIAASLHGLSARWLQGERLSAADRARIRYTAALIDWWIDPSADVAPLTRDGSPEQRFFFEHLDAIERHAFVPATPSHPAPWEQLYAIWRDGTVPAALDAGSPAFADALRRRIAKQRSSFVRLLTEPTAGEAGLVRFGQNERPGYSVLARNQDGFPLRDLYVYPENVLVERYASFLFPPKAGLPDRLLLATMSACASTAAGN